MALIITLLAASFIAGIGITLGFYFVTFIMSLILGGPSSDS